MNRIRIPYELQKMNKIFRDNGFEAYLVGGAVRDILLGKKAADWDVASNAKPEDVMRIFHKVIPTGIEHGTVTVHFMQHEIEVTTYRIDDDYTDGRHPGSVTYTSDITQDLSRRDFTMNAIAASLDDGAVVDPFHGEDDIKHKIIRTVGKPEERFDEDGLRPVRAVRFAAKTGFSIDPETLAAIPRALGVTAKISIERFRDEFLKLVGAPEPVKGLRLMEETGIMKLFLPEFYSCRGVVQADGRGIHQFDVLDHLYNALEGAVWIENQRGSDTNLMLRLAALFHDIGKPASRKIMEKALDPAAPEKTSTIYTFYNHEAVGAETTFKILNRLRLPKAQSRYVAHLVRQHMFFYESSWTDAAIRRFLVRITPPDAKDTSPSSAEIDAALNDIFDLRIADVYGMTRTPPVLAKGVWSENLIEFRERIDKIIAEKNAITIKNLAVNGKDLMGAGIPSGKEIGRILNELLEAVLEDPALNEKEKLLTIARNFVKETRA